MAKSRINNFAVRLIEKYQKDKPPYKNGRCIHYPCCSSYAKECYQKFNFFKASFLSFKRILFCTPLNKKVYDPVPYTKEEKKLNKCLDEEALKIKDILINHYHKYPLMQLDDFFKLIYQNNFGPNHLNLEKVKSYLDDEIDHINKENEEIEDIGNGYVRLYLSSFSNSSLISKYLIQSKIEVNDHIYPLFYRKLAILNKLINKRIIKLKKKESSKRIKEYIFSLDYEVHHSDIYKLNYDPHYRIIKKEYIEYLK